MWRSRLAVDPTLALFEQADGFSKYVILTRLENAGASDPVVAALRQTLLAGITGAQAPDGSWGGGVYRDFFNGTTKQLYRLGVLGCGPDHPAVAAGVRYVAEHQLPSGAVAETREAEVPGTCRHHFTGNMCVALDCLTALTAVGLAEGPLVEGLARWIRRWQREDGSWWSPGAAGREFRGVSGEPGCGLWLTSWALLALSSLRSANPAAGAACRRGARFLLGRYGRVPGLAWYQSPDEFMWCSVGVRLPDENMEAAVTGSVLHALAAGGLGLEEPLIASGVKRLLALQGPDGFWRVGHPRVDGWLTLTVLLTLARLHQEDKSAAAVVLTPAG